MSRYGARAQLDPRVNVYHDDDMDFSRGSFGTTPRAIPIRGPSERSHPSPPPKHSAAPLAPASEISERPRTEYRGIRYSNSEVDDEATPPPATPAPSAYIAWTGGVQYADPKHAIVEPISTEELLEGLSDMRIQREKRNTENGTGPRGPPGLGLNRDNGYGDRAVGGARRGDLGFEDRGVRSGGDKGDPWGGDDDGLTSNWIGAGGGGGGQTRGSGCFNCGLPEHRSFECTEEKKPRYGSGSGGGGGGLGGFECYNCHEQGHRSANCTQERIARGGGGGGGGGACYNCGEDGHFSRECPNAPTSAGRACYNCGQPGHESRDCPNDRVMGAFRGECHNCGEQGHAFRDCPNERRAGAFQGTCHSCGQEGHQSRDCDQSKNLGGRYDGISDDRSPAVFGDQVIQWGANPESVSPPSCPDRERLLTEEVPGAPGLMKVSVEDDGWKASPVHQTGFDRASPGLRGRKTERGGDEWGAPSPAFAPSARALPAFPHLDEDGWNRSEPCAVEELSVAQGPPPTLAGPGPGIHPDRLRMLSKQGVDLGNHANRQEIGRDRPPHMDRGGAGVGYGRGEGRVGESSYGNRPISAPFRTPPLQMRQAPPAPSPVKDDEFDGW